MGVKATDSLFLIFIDADLLGITLARLNALVKPVVAG